MSNISQANSGPFIQLRLALDDGLTDICNQHLESRSNQIASCRCPSDNKFTCNVVHGMLIITTGLLFQLGFYLIDDCHAGDSREVDYRLIILVLYVSLRSTKHTRSVTPLILHLFAKMIYYYCLHYLMLHAITITFIQSFINIFALANSLHSL